MSAANSRATILAYSRIAGVLLSIAVVAFAAILVSLGRRWDDAERDSGRAHARAFIDKVRACRRATTPHPSWNECELRVRDAE